ncbi:MAG: M48 family metallopeptidase [Solirubrobacterales bacterium]
MGVAGLFRRPQLDADATPVDFDYAIRRSSRARSIRITVDHGGVVVTLPERTAERHAHEFVAERAQWVERSLLKLAAEQDLVAARSLADGAVVPYLGDELTLQLLAGPSGRVHRPRGSDVLRVHVPDDSRQTVAEALERWYRRQAKLEFARRLDAAVERNGTSYERVTIRDQKTRWGSCSTSGTISFNWRLLLAPEDVLDYVIEHEAAHIEIRDHSPRFWALLQQRVPEWRESRDWLRKNGGTLRLV